MQGYFRVVKEELGELVKLNLVFLLYCIPVVTIPAAVCALVSALVELLRGRGESAASAFRQAFRGNFRSYSLVGLASLLPLLISLVVLLHHLPGLGADPASTVLVVCNCMVAAVLGVWAFYFVPMAVKIDLPLGDCAKNAVILGMSRGVRAMPILLALFFLYALLFRLMPFTLPLLAAAGFSLPLLAAVSAAWQSIRQRVVEED